MGYVVLGTEEIMSRKAGLSNRSMFESLSDAESTLSVKEVTALEN